MNYHSSILQYLKQLKSEAKNIDINTEKYKEHRIRVKTLNEISKLLLANGEISKFEYAQVSEFVFRFIHSVRRNNDNKIKGGIK